MSKEQKLKINMIQCLKCCDIIESTHRHDFRWCKCGAVAVDGGTEYQRWVGDLKNICDMSEYEQEDEEGE